jgi:taurine transport system substrate-binding protein
VERKEVKIMSALALLSAACLGVTGCAINGQPEKPTVRIGYLTAPTGDLVVKNNRWLENALIGYNIRWIKFEVGADVNIAFVAKDLDIGALGSSPLARGLSPPLSIPYAVAIVLDVAGTSEALVARNGARIATIADLKGKRVATPFASTAHYALLAALRQNSMSPNDIQLINLEPQAILAAWERGDIDAADVWEPVVDQLRVDGKDLITSGQLAAEGKPSLELGAVSLDFAKAHPDVLDVWRQQQIRAVNTIRDDPLLAARAIAAEIGQRPADVEVQLKQTVFLTAEQMASEQWLGTDGRPGGIAVYLQNNSQFLVDEQQIPIAPPLQTFQNAIYTKGLPHALTP